jgi:hypothetical protein
MKKYVDNMSDLTYLLSYEPKRQTACMDAWRNYDASFSENARIEAGYLFRQIQKGIKLSLIDVCKQRIKRYETDVKKGKKEK